MLIENLMFLKLQSSIVTVIRLGLYEISIRHEKTTYLNNMLKKFGFSYPFDIFASNQLVYLEIYQSLSYGKQKV